LEINVSRAFLCPGTTRNHILLGAMGPFGVTSKTRANDLLEQRVLHPPENGGADEREGSGVLMI